MTQTAEEKRANARAYQARRRLEDPEAVARLQRESYERHREARLAKNAVRKVEQGYRNDPLVERAGHYRRKYGLTIENYNRLLIEQGGRCAICRTDNPGGRGNFHVDHDHDTGKVRGLLCKNCNIMLGHARDNVELLMAAAAFLLQSENVLNNAEENVNV